MNTDLHGCLSSEFPGVATPLHQHRMANMPKEKTHMTEENRKKKRSERVRESLWEFTKFTLIAGTYLGLHAFVITTMASLAIAGSIGVAFAVTMSVVFTASIHFWIFAANA